MNDKIKQLWISALRSGEYSQNQNSLRQGNSFCCLGVLCDVAIKNGVDLKIYEDDNIYFYDEACEVLPKKVIDWAELNDDNPIVEMNEDGKEGEYSLAELNDSEYNFNQIADIIEEQL